jgi:Amidohydrolase
MAWTKTSVGLLCAPLLLSAVSAALAADGPLPAPAFEVSSARSDLDRRARRFHEPYAGDIIDALAHVTPSSRGGRGRTTDYGAVVEQIRAAGVARAYLMPTPNEGGNPRRDDGTTDKIALAKRAGDLISIFCAGDYLSTWMYGAQLSGYREAELQTRLSRIESELDGGTCAGIGEFGLLHFNKTGYQPEIRIRSTFPPVLALMALAERKGAWIDVHAEPVEPNGVSHEAEVFGGLALWLGRNPALKLILSHTAMTNPANARRLLTTYPGVMLTVKRVKAGGTSWVNLEPVLNHRGEIYEDWAALIEEMPGRFLLGSDAKFASDRHSSGDKYDEEIALFRKVLGSLTPAAADALAHGNAQRLLPRSPTAR